MDLFFWMDIRLGSTSLMLHGHSLSSLICQAVHRHVFFGDLVVLLFLYPELLVL